MRPVERAGPPFLRGMGGISVMAPENFCSIITSIGKRCCNGGIRGREGARFGNTVAPEGRDIGNDGGLKAGNEGAVKVVSTQPHYPCI